MKPFCSKDKTVNKNGKEVHVCDGVRSSLMEELQKIQKSEGYISDGNIQDIADRFELHPVEVYSVVTFYSFLSLSPRGKNVLRISTCMPCEMKGSAKVIEAFEKALGIKCGEITGDGQTYLEATSCIGMCDKAPAMMVNENLVGPVSPEDVDGIIRGLKKN